MTSAPCVDSSWCCVREVWCVGLGSRWSICWCQLFSSPHKTSSRDLARPSAAALFLGRLPLTININDTQLSRYVSSLHQSMCLMEHQHQCLGVYTLQTFTTERNSLNEPYHDAVKIDGDNLNNNKRYIFIPLSLILVQNVLKQWLTKYEYYTLQFWNKTHIILDILMMTPINIDDINMNESMEIMWTCVVQLNISSSQDPTVICTLRPLIWPTAEGLVTDHVINI